MQELFVFLILWMHSGDAQCVQPSCRLVEHHDGLLCVSAEQCVDRAKVEWVVEGIEDGWVRIESESGERYEVPLGRCPGLVEGVVLVGGMPSVVRTLQRYAAAYQRLDRLRRGVEEPEELRL
ncbi:MAG: hypothetical protein RBU37_07025 [Myxococcota bacterium]|nr:hypothetical protein [Myxococcota bacterium]